MNLKNLTVFTLINFSIKKNFSHLKSFENNKSFEII